MVGVNRDDLLSDSCEIVGHTNLGGEYDEKSLFNNVHDRRAIMISSSVRRALRSAARSPVSLFFSNNFKPFNMFGDDFSGLFARTRQ